MKKTLQNNAKTKEYLDSLPRIYLVACWAKYGVRSFPLAKWKKENGNMIPLVYDYEDCNGVCDMYILRDIRYTTTGYIVCWVKDEWAANLIARKLNKENENV